MPRRGVGYGEIVGALDELDALDAMAGSDDWVGDYLAVGDEDLELSALSGYGELVGTDEDLAALMAAAGAAPRRAARPQPSRLARLAKRLNAARQVDPHAVAVVDRPEDRRREFPIGLIAAAPTPFGGSGQATALPQVRFRSERLIVPSEIAPSFTIDAIVVGKDTQQVSFDSLPATMFSEVGVGVRLSLKTAIVGHQIVVRFTNIDPLQRTILFRGGIIGTAVE